MSPFLEAQKIVVIDFVLLHSNDLSRNDCDIEVVSFIFSILENNAPASVASIGSEIF